MRANEILKKIAVVARDPLVRVMISILGVLLAMTSFMLMVGIPVDDRGPCIETEVRKQPPLWGYAPDGIVFQIPRPDATVCVRHEKDPT